MNKISYLLIILLLGLSFTSCEKEEEEEAHNHSECCSANGECDKNCTMSCCASGDNGMQMRIAMQEDGYTEVEINPTEKIECYFEEWDKTILTAVSGLFEYYDQNNTWVASIDFGDGTCDTWGVKIWDTNMFPDYPEGSIEFSLFE